jgi:hypothetical protein
VELCRPIEKVTDQLFEGEEADELFECFDAIATRSATTSASGGYIDRKGVKRGLLDAPYPSTCGCCVNS